MSFAEIRKSTVTASQGMPELYIDGQKTPPLFYALSDIPAGRAWTERSQTGIKQFAERGIHIVCIDTNLYEGWQENGEYSPASTFKEMQAVLQANPKAKIIVRLHMNAPYWWLRKHPEEWLVVYGEKHTDCGGYADRILDNDRPASEIKASFASEKWLNDAGEMLAQYCQKIKDSPFGEYLIGIQPAYGSCGEWHSFGGLLADYSAPMTRFYRKVVKDIYQTEEKLKEFYGENARFDNLEIPLPEIRNDYNYGRFYHPKTDAPVVDSFRCYSLAAVQAISHFCRIIKRTWGAGILAGSFYGYFFSVGGATSAHLETSKIYENDDIDFLAGPGAYGENKFAGNANTLRHLPESNRINGKLFLCEMDQGYSSHCAGGTANSAIYTCENQAEFSAITIRNIMENILHGNGAWFYEHRLTHESKYKTTLYWDSPESHDTIIKIRQACEKIQSRPFVKSTDVLIVQSTEALYYQLNGWFPFSYAHRAFLDAVAKSGVGFDHVYLADLEKCDLKRYKCVIFINCTVLSKAKFDYIKNKVMKDGRTVCFMLKCGRILDGEVSDENVEKLVGRKLLPEIFYQTDDCSVYYCENAVYSAQWYNGVFRKAGAHIYTDHREVVVADNNLVMVHCKNIAKTHLHLKDRDILLDNGACNTYVFDVETGERLL